MSSLFSPLPQNSSNLFVPLTKAQDVIDNWDFFAEGLNVLNNPQGARGDVTPPALLNLVLNVVEKGLDFGIVALLKSKNGKNLGFGICYDNTEPYCMKSAIVYAVYSNKKSPTTTRELLYHGEKWAREHNFKDLHACSRRFSGASLRLFEDIWGFSRACIVFRKPL